MSSCSAASPGSGAGCGRPSCGTPGRTPGSGWPPMAWPAWSTPSYCPVTPAWPHQTAASSSWRWAGSTHNPARPCSSTTRPATSRRPRRSAWPDISTPARRRPRLRSRPSSPPRGLRAGSRYRPGRCHREESVTGSARRDARNLGVLPTLPRPAEHPHAVQVPGQHHPRIGAGVGHPAVQHPRVGEDHVSGLAGQFGHPDRDAVRLMITFQEPRCAWGRRRAWTAHGTSRHAARTAPGRGGHGGNPAGWTWRSGLPPGAIRRWPRCRRRR